MSFESVTSDSVIASFLAAAKKTTTIRWLIGAYLIHEDCRYVFSEGVPDEHAILFALEHGVCFRDLQGEPFFCLQRISMEDVENVARDNIDCGSGEPFLTFNHLDHYCTPSFKSNSYHFTMCAGKDFTISEDYIKNDDYDELEQARLVGHCVRVRQCLSKVGIDSTMSYRHTITGKVTAGIPSVSIRM